MKKPAQPQAAAQAEALYETYKGKSEAELMTALRDMSAEERAQLGALQQELAPILSEEQQRKLSAIIRSLTS